MRHGKKFNHLGRKKGHRDALLMNLANSLILHKRINTTLAKAKSLRVFVEPILTKSKLNTTHSRRMVFADLRQKEVVKELFDVVATKIADRPGGYCRIIKTGFRKGDGAEMAMIELVDFNEVMLKSASGSKSGSRRRRRGKAGSVGAVAATTSAPVVNDVAAQSEEE